MGLFAAPAERHMGEVQRIMYIHVPCAWVAMLAYTFAFGFAISSLWTSRAKWDAILTATVKTGLVLNGLLLVQGMIWARATWGVWWDWDVRLTTSLVMFLLFAGVLALRSFVQHSEQRASWTAITTIVAYIDVPLVYFCVRWWRSLHQIQSTPETIDRAMILPLRLNAFAMLFIAIWYIAHGALLELGRAKEDTAPVPEKLFPEPEVKNA
jgi:heme exporter protein C